MTERTNGRFTGFSELYDSGRPTLPRLPLDMAGACLNSPIRDVVDIGCGTGLSTVTCSSIFENVIGIDPSADMLSVANKRKLNNARFMIGSAENTGLLDGSFDMIVCSQNFHWFNAQEALKEFNRILKKAGVLLIVDYDNMPNIKPSINEVAYDFRRSIFKEHKNCVDEHQKKEKKYYNELNDSKIFGSIIEFSFWNPIRFNVDKYLDFVLSKSSVQMVNRIDPDLYKKALKKLKEDVTREFVSDYVEGNFRYHGYIAIKGERDE